MRNFSATRNILSQSMWKSIWRIILYIVYPLLCFINIINVSKVASGSMTPSILTHDIVLLMKYNITFGDIISIFLPIFTNLFTNPDSTLVINLPILLKPIITLRNMQIGDVITFTTTGDPSVYTKRIIAKGGDVVQMMYGRYYINGKVLPLKYKGKHLMHENNMAIEGEVYEETNGDCTYEILMTDGLGLNSDISDKFYVPAKHYFVSGNNRHHSDDGFSMLSFIPEENIKYQVVANIFSNANLTTLDPQIWWNSIRYKHTFTFVV